MVVVSASAAQREELGLEIFDLLRRVHAARARAQARGEGGAEAGFGEPADAGGEAERAVLRQLAGAAKAFEAEVFARSGADSSAYAAAMRCKVSELRDKLEQAQRDEMIQLNTFRQRVGNEHLKHKLRGLDTGDHAALLSAVVVLQACYRCRRARRLYQRRVRAISLLQRVFRARREFRRRQRLAEDEAEAAAGAAEEAEEAEERAARMAHPRRSSLVRRSLVANSRTVAVAVRIQRWFRRHRHDASLFSLARLSAAIRFHTAKLSKATLTAWSEYVRRAAKARRLLRFVIDKFVVTQLAYAVKLWWVSTRDTYSVRSMAGARVVVRDLGAPMPCELVYGEHFVPRRHTVADNFPETVRRGRWRDWALLEAKDPRRRMRPAAASPDCAGPLSPRAALFATVAKEALRNQVLVGQDLRVEVASRSSDWALPSALAKKKRDKIERAMSEQDRRVLARLAAPDAFKPLPAAQVETATAIVAALKARKEAFQAGRRHTPRNLPLLPPALGRVPINI
jgi:hypothetical protein